MASEFPSHRILAIFISQTYIYFCEVVGAQGGTQCQICQMLCMSVYVKNKLKLFFKKNYFGLHPVSGTKPPKTLGILFLAWWEWLL